MKRLFLGAAALLLTASAWAVDLCSVVSIGTESAFSNPLTPGLPATYAPGDYLLTFVADTNSSAVTSGDPVDYTLLKQSGSVNGGTNLELWGKIAGENETAQAITWNGGTSKAFTVALHNPGGFANEASILGDSSTGNENPGGPSVRHNALTVTQGGGCALQFGMYGFTNVNGNVTGITTQSGYVAAGFGAGNGTVGLAIHGQLYDGDATSPDLAVNYQTPTGSSTGSRTAGISVTLLSGDIAPTAYAYTDVTGQALSSTITSAAITVAGIANWAGISVSGDTGCQWDKNNAGAWSASAGYIQLNDTVKVRVTSSGSELTGKACTSTIGGVADTFTATTGTSAPTAYSYVDITGATATTTYTSASVVLAGITLSSSAITVSGDTGCKWDKNNAGSFSSSAGTVANGDTVKVQVTSGTSGQTKNCASTIGGVADTYSVTTGSDTTPSAFTFTDQTLASLATLYTSTSITVLAIDAAADITITGTSCQYEKNGSGTWTSSAGTVILNDTVKARGTSSASETTALNCAVTIGGVSDTYTITTADFTPSAFSFVDQTDVALDTVITSAPVTIAGLTGQPTVTVTSGSGECSVNGGSYGASCGTISNGQTFTARNTSSLIGSDQVDTTVSIGGVTDTFSITTAALTTDTTTQLLISDAFTDSDGVTGPNHTMTLNVPGNPWETVVVNSSAPTAATISSNRLSVPSNTGNVTSIGTSDAMVDCSIVTSAATDVFSGLVARHNGLTGTSLNYYAVEFRMTGATGLGSSVLTKTVAGVKSTLVSKNETFTAGNTYRLTLFVNGNTVGYSLDGGASTDSVQDTSIPTGTRFGVYASQVATSTKFDNCTIQRSHSGVMSDTGRVADDPGGVFNGEQLTAGSVWWALPSDLPNETYNDWVLFDGGSYLYDPETNFVGADVWSWERYRAVSNTVETNTVTFNTTDTGTVAPTLNVVPTQTCALNTDPGPLLLAGYLNVVGQPAPTFTITGLPTGRVPNVLTGAVTGLCTVPGTFSVTVVAENATGSASRTFDYVVTADNVPDAFSFLDQFDVMINSTITSAAITVSGLDAGVTSAVTVSSGQWDKNDAGNWSVSAGTVVNGDTVKVRHTASGTDDTAVSTTLTIGGVSDTFTSRTAVVTPADDTTPDTFAFAPQTGVALAGTITSNTVTIAGIDAAATTSVSGGTWSKNGGAFGAGAGSVVLGDTVAVRHTASASANTPTNTTLTVGGVTATFTSTTTAGSAPVCTSVPTQHYVLQNDPASVNVASHCTGVDSWSGTDADLPLGTSRNGGVISGQYNAANTYVSTVTASNQFGSTRVKLLWVVSPSTTGSCQGGIVSGVLGGVTR